MSNATRNALFTIAAVVCTVAVTVGVLHWL